MTAAKTEQQLPELIQRGELDLACCQLPPLDAPVDRLEVMQDRFVLLVPGDSPVATSREPLAPAELERLPLVALTGVWPRVAGWLRSRGVHADPLVRCDSSTTVLSVVAEGLGAAIVPCSCVDPRHPGATIAELAAPPARTLALCWQRRRPRPPATEPLAYALRQELERV